MKTIYTTSQFDTWFDKLRDAQGKRRIQARIDRMEDGYFVGQRVLHCLNCHYYY